MSPTTPRADVPGLAARLSDVYLSTRQLASRAAARFPMPGEQASLSRDNLLAYLALRQRDLNELQLELADAGLSSLGRLESCVISSLESVLARFGALPLPATPGPTRREAAAILAGRSRNLLGPSPGQRATRIMVTVDAATATNEAKIDGLVRAGMDLIRINTARGEPADWTATVAAVRDAECRVAGAALSPRPPARVYMDLSGPKLRTGPVEDDVRVSAGESLRLLRDDAAASAGRSEGSPPTITCTIPEALDAVRVGAGLYIDEGRIRGTVVSVAPGWVDLRIDFPADGARIRPNRSINLPDSLLHLPSVSSRDRRLLPEIAAIADVVGLSFVHRAEDVRALGEMLAEIGRPGVGIVAKIETRDAFRNLPQILLTGLTLPSFGVMVARGDLAVEAGFTQLAVLQEEILCLCEAAHLPTIWATQVLQELARTGLPARAEITDAAASQRAECVMLNKGKHIIEAVTTLSDLLAAEERRHEKKRQLLRELTDDSEVFLAADLAGDPP